MQRSHRPIGKSHKRVAVVVVFVAIFIVELCDSQIDEWRRCTRVQERTRHKTEQANIAHSILHRYLICFIRFAGEMRGGRLCAVAARGKKPTAEDWCSLPYKSSRCGAVLCALFADTFADPAAGTRLTSVCRSRGGGKNVCLCHPSRSRMFFVVVSVCVCVYPFIVNYS